MISLFIDTTQKEHHLALINDEKIVTRYDFLAENNIDNQFQQELDSFLKENKISIRDIRSLIVNIGPGTFTGTRTGIAFANALKLANPKIELRAVSGENVFDQQVLDSLKRPPIDYLVPEYSNPPSITRPKS